MVRRKPRRKPLGTIWEISDELWRRIEPILLEFWPKKPTGRKVANWRKMLNAIIFRLRSGCQWDQLPERYGPKSTVHDWFQRWAAAGIFERIWAVLVAECDELGGIPVSEHLFTRRTTTRARLTDDADNSGDIIPNSEELSMVSPELTVSRDDRHDHDPLEDVGVN